MVSLLQSLQYRTPKFVHKAVLRWYFTTTVCPCPVYKCIDRVYPVITIVFNSPKCVNICLDKNMIALYIKTIKCIFKTCLDFSKTVKTFVIKKII